ncbi:MAG: hypothetical protein ACK4ND_00865 [Cytophagaceae bacterium]
MTRSLRNKLLPVAVSIVLAACSTASKEQDYCRGKIEQGICGIIINEKEPELNNFLVSKAEIAVPNFKSFEQTLEYLNKKDHHAMYPVTADEAGYFHKILAEGRYKITIPGSELKYKILPDTIITVRKNSVCVITIELEEN